MEEVFCEFKNSLAKLTGYNEKLVQGDFLRKFKKGDLKSGRSSLSTRHAQLSKDMSYMRLLNADDPSSLAMDITTDEDLGINIFTSTYHQPKKESSPTPPPVAKPTTTKSPRPPPVAKPTTTKSSRPPPVAKPTTTKSPRPPPVAKPTTTKPPTSNANEGCYEDSKAQFLFEKKRGKVKTRSCKQLRNILTYDSEVCNSDISNEDFLPVKDVCQVSCKNCPGGCGEVSFDKFFFETKEDGNVKTMRCAHLKRKRQKISAEKLQEICSREAPSGYSNGNFVCPITCGVCA